MPLCKNGGVLGIRFCRGEVDKVDAHLGVQNLLCVGCGECHDQEWKMSDRQCGSHSGVRERITYYRTPNTHPHALYTARK